VKFSPAEVSEGGHKPRSSSSGILATFFRRRDPVTVHRAALLVSRAPRRRVLGRIL